MSTENQKIEDQYPTETAIKFRQMFNNAMAEIASQYSVNILSSMPMVYAKMFKMFPDIIEIDTDGLYLNETNDEKVNPEDKELAGLEIYTLNQDSGEIVPAPITDDEPADDDTKKTYTFKDVDKNKSFLKLCNEHPELARVRLYDYPMLIGDEVIIYFNRYEHEFTVLQQGDKLKQWIIDCIVETTSTDELKYFDYVTYGPSGFDSMPLEVKKQDVNLDMNYNDDLPYDDITNFLNSKQSGIIILHGNPGTGKTTFIRHLIYSIDKDFLVLDNSTFNYITDSSFIQLLLDYKNAVIILEDCESMLVDRMSGNGKLSALLNLSDGIIGDSFNFKFICTFNADIGKIDKALLRKGRMKLKYEFKSLTAEKTKALAESIGIQVKPGESLPLSDIYNYNEENDHTKKQKIGFAK